MNRRTVIDHFTGEPIDAYEAIRFVADVIEGLLIFDYTGDSTKVISANNGEKTYFYDKDRFEKEMIYDRGSCTYRMGLNMRPADLIRCMYDTTSKYIYSFGKEYEANTHLDLFKGCQKLIHPIQEFKLANFLKYTFGVEFETATGTLPEDICFRDGLIPLRDGSIGGNEYSTVVLSGNEGLNLLKQQVETLKDFTYFDKNCSLHIHLGGFPLEPNTIYNIYKICVSIQNELEKILPQYTFRTSEYKDTHKDYCKKLPANLYSFESLYKYMVGSSFFGDLTQPHPADIRRERKWNIDKRYFFVNFINTLCYKGGKTIEFRFLRPTYNFNKIIFWLYIFNAILICAENSIIPKSLEELVRNIYPEDISNDLMKNCMKSQICSNIQSRLGDYIGARTDIEDNIFNTNELI